MISSLNGKVIALESASAVVDVNGVGFSVLISSSTAKCLSVDHSAFLHTALVVRDDGFTLFGFSSVTELRVFELLRSVSGVGPKSALAILGELSVEQIIDAVGQENDAAFKLVSGIGPKTAKLIIVTLAGKLGSTSSTSSKTSTASTSDLSLVVEALTGLGWNERSALEAASRASEELGAVASTNNLLKVALAQLGTSKSVGASDE